jgi:hypothetical protein
MSRYYFHSVTADGLLKDDVGVEVEDVDLQREASKAVFELENEFGTDDEELIVLGFRVVDHVGRTVLELPLRDTMHLSH